ncbi:MAG TPA: methyltransferase domain-containing protein [Methylomirabilota bacterium]|nr:methyltransferase domain-containing protein [Methylomirabilota bacterium]
MSRFDDEWRGRFERFARAHRDDAAVSGWSDAGLRRRLQLFATMLSRAPLPAGARILELGCGAGTYVRLLGGLGYRPVGLDYSLPTLGRALASDPGAKGAYVAGDAYALPFPDRSFDMVMSIGVLQALSDPERALDEMVRVLTPAGRLVVEALNASGLLALARAGRDRLLRRPERVRTYAPELVRRWLAARGLRTASQLGVYLPPRRFPRVERFLDLGIVAAADRCPTVTRAMAHAVWFVAHRESAG